MDDPKSDRPPQDAETPQAAPPQAGAAAPVSVAPSVPDIPPAPSAQAPVQAAAPDAANNYHSAAHLVDEDQDALPPAPPVQKTTRRRKRRAAWRVWIPAVLLFLSMAYLVAEIEFNMSLLDVAGSVRSDPAKLEDLQVFGRAVSASGCVLLVLGLFAGAGFHAASARLRGLYYFVALLCTVPMLLIFSTSWIGPDSVPIDPTGGDILLALIPILGVGYGSAVGRGRNAFVTVLTICMMVWPAVFLGQKLLIEQALIERTNWEQRVNARYVLMLRSILEDCTINLNELALCDVEDEQDSVKSARIILGSMWMLSPDRIRSDMEENKDKMVQSVASRGMWFSPREQYDSYVAVVAEERRKMQQQVIDTYYMPYRKASEDYMKAVSEEVLKAESQKAATEVEQEIDRGWDRYKGAVREYNYQLSASGVRIFETLAPHKQRLNELCNKVNCPPLLRGKERGLVSDYSSQAEREFSRQSGGYSPDIKTRGEFLAAYPTQVMLRNRVQEYITNRLPESGLILPANWLYEKEGFRQSVEALRKQEIDRRWRARMPKDLQPGLSIQAFFDATGMPPLPDLEALVMSPDTFFKKMLLPRYRDMLDKILGDIESEKENYANGAELAEKGRDYARAVLIPAIALIISLLVVIMTMLRWWNIAVRAALAALMRRHLIAPSLRMPIQLGMVALFVGLIVVVPRFMPNPYAGATYERYRDEAVIRAPVTARVLDWAIHTQPAVYRLGSPIRDVLDYFHKKPDTAKPTKI